MKILIVDDSAFTRKNIKTIVEEAGYETFEAKGGKEALEIFEKQHPGIITVDLVMPEMDGMELIGRLRNLSAEVKIVVVSADVQDVTRKEVFSAGASAFVAKTVIQSDLLHTIKGFLENGSTFLLTSHQEDAFKEILNISMQEAAQALESLLNRRVQLMVPKMRILGLDELPLFLKKASPRIGTAVQQVFSGKVRGQAYLVFPENQAEILIHALLESHKAIDELSAAEQSVLSEVGNVVLNSSIAQVANLLRTRLKASLPVLFLSITSEYLSTVIRKAFSDNNHSIMLLSDMRVGEITMSCFIALVLEKKGIAEILARLGV